MKNWEERDFYTVDFALEMRIGLQTEFEFFSF
jgi:hypothetical protein